MCWRAPEVLPARKRNLSGLKEAGRALPCTICPTSASALPKLRVQPQKDWPQLTYTLWNPGILPIIGAPSGLTARHPIQSRTGLSPCPFTLSKIASKALMSGFVALTSAPPPSRSVRCPSLFSTMTTYSVPPALAWEV